MENIETPAVIPVPSDPACVDPDSKPHSLYDPPAYLQMLGQALHHCGISESGVVQTADQAARELRALEMTTEDSDSREILRAHIHVLNGVFARLIARGIEQPIKHHALIASALRAQQQCIESVNALRQNQDGV